MNSSVEIKTSPAIPQGTPYPKTHNPYAKSPNRRAIACTICAKAKTKCDKAVPSCSRCTAKGLVCQPRSTRRTSDNSYRNTKRHLVTPKRYPSTQSVPSMSRHSSPRSVPPFDRPALARASSQMDFHTAVKLGHQQTNFGSMPLLTPYTPQIIDGCYSYSSSPEQNMAPFPQQMNKSAYLGTGSLSAPGTPETFYNDSFSIPDPFDSYMNTQAWSDDGNGPVGLGFESDIPGLIPVDPTMRMWSCTPEPEGIATPMGNMSTYEPSLTGSPIPMNAWPTQSMSVSPPQLPHSRAVPSLSLSDGSLQDFDSPNHLQDEWSFNKPITSSPFLDGMKSIPKHPQIWDDSMLSGSATF